MMALLPYLTKRFSCSGAINKWSEDDKLYSALTWDTWCGSSRWGGMGSCCCCCSPTTGWMSVDAAAAAAAAVIEGTSMTLMDDDDEEADEDDDTTDGPE